MFDHRGTYYAETIWRSDIVAARSRGGVEWRDEMKGQATTIRNGTQKCEVGRRYRETEEEDRKGRSLVGNMSLLDSLGMVGRRYTTSLFITSTLVLV